jgi:division protein CdvB (Snf7/Vps24/ESCRT-III family)
MNEIKAKITVDTQELEDATDLIEEVGERLNSVVPNITIRNNQNVYVTINNFNETESKWGEKNERN